MDKTKIARINALAKKAKTIGLTARETAERDALRKEYLAEMRASFKAQLDSTYVQTADGAKIPYAEYARTAKEAANDIQAEHAGQGSANTPKSEGSLAQLHQKSLWKSARQYAIIEERQRIPDVPGEG